MKKPYTKPTAEKLAFQYRDQVVAASGDPANGGGTGSEKSNTNTLCEIYDGYLEITQGGLDGKICW